MGLTLVKWTLNVSGTWHFLYQTRLTLFDPKMTHNKKGNYANESWSKALFSPPARWGSLDFTVTKVQLLPFFLPSSFLHLLPPRPFSCCTVEWAPDTISPAPDAVGHAWTRMLHSMSDRMVEGMSDRMRGCGSLEVKYFFWNPAILRVSILTQPAPPSCFAPSLGQVDDDDETLELYTPEVCGASPGWSHGCPGWGPKDFQNYPLVIQHNYWKSPFFPMFHGKINYKWPFSIAMLVITRG